MQQPVADSARDPDPVSLPGLLARPIAPSMVESSADPTPDLMILALVAARIGSALVDASRLSPTAAADLLRRIATETRELAGRIDALASSLDPIEDAEIVVTCSTCGTGRPWQPGLPACSCGGVL